MGDRSLIAAVGSSWLAPKELISAGDWMGIEKLASEAVALVRGNEMTVASNWIALDWGTSVWAWKMSPEGHVLDRASSDRGMSSLSPEQPNQLY